MSLFKKIFGFGNKISAEKFYSSSVSTYRTFTQDLESSPLTSSMKYSSSEVVLFVASVHIAIYLSKVFIKEPDTTIVTEFIHLLGKKMSEENNYSRAELGDFYNHFDEVIISYCPHIEEHYKSSISAEPSNQHILLMADKFIKICLPPNPSPLFKPQLLVSISKLLIDSPRLLLK